MAGNNMSNQAGGMAGVNVDRLFVGSCMGLVSTSVVFAAVTQLIPDLQKAFALTNTEAGWILGAAIWGFTVSIFIFGPLCDAIGMGRLLRFSLICHIGGPLLMIFAGGAHAFGMLFSGAVIIALGNGTIEAVCNPLTTTIYSGAKTKQLNRFHMWWPGGLVLGGLASFGLDKLDPAVWTNLNMACWQAKMGLVFVPAVLYGIIFTGQKFPATERLQSGLSFGEMVKGTFERPLFWLLFICMGMTASIELGPERWMGKVMEPAMRFLGPNAGILMLVYVNILMAVLRFYAGPIVDRLSPTGMLVSSSVLAGAGLLLITYAQGPWIILITATVYSVGICYFWPCMLGVTSERVPKGGSLALGLMGGWGMAVTGILTVPVMGVIVDSYGFEKLPPAETRQVIEQGYDFLVQLEKTGSGDAVKNIDKAIEIAGDVKAKTVETGQLPKRETAKALREIARYGGLAESPAGKEISDQANKLIGPADEYGGPISFRYISALAIFLIIVFGAFYLKDLSKGGYKQEHIGS